MKIEFFNLLNLDFQNIKIKKPSKIFSKNLFKIHYLNNNIIIKLTNLLVYKNSSVYEDGYMHIDIFLDNTDYEYINKFEDYILKFISKIYPEYKYKFKYSNNILRVMNYNYNNVLLYDQKNNKIEAHKITKEDKISIIFIPEYFIESNNKCYIKYNLLEAKIDKITINNRLFDEEYNCDMDIYIKMKKFKIPDEAIKNKMIMNNLNENIINSFFEKYKNDDKCKSISISPPPPPPPLPPPPNFNIKMNKENTMNLVLDNIKNKNFKLKSITKEENEIFNENKKIYLKPNIKVPTLEEIQNALKKLRKI